MLATSHLHQLGVGDISLASNTLRNGCTEHILIAYQVAGGGGVNIADVTLANHSGSIIAGFVNTADTHLTVTAVDMINITGANLPSLNPHNIHSV